MSEAYWKERAERLEAAATDVLSAFEPASVVHIGSSHYKYSAAWPTHIRNPVQRLRDALAPQSEPPGHTDLMVTPESIPDDLGKGDPRVDPDAQDATPRATDDPWESGALGESEEHVRVCTDPSVYEAADQVTAGTPQDEESGDDHESRRT